jgi:hypothetical protein
LHIRCCRVGRDGVATEVPDQRTQADGVRTLTRDPTDTLTPTVKSRLRQITLRAEHKHFWHIKRSVMKWRPDIECTN